MAEKRITDVTDVTVEMGLDKKLIQKTEFPFEIFPEFLTSLTEKYAKALHVSKKQIAFYMLTIASGCIGNSIRVSPKKGWEQPINIWSAYVKESGKGGSHPMRALMQPVNERQSVKWSNISGDFL